MKSYRHLLSVLLIAIAFVSHAQDEIRYVEGLLYSDSTPVKIEVRNGRISKITRLKNLTDNKKKLFIAPGFIDNQVNGYNGVSFEEDILTHEKVVTVIKALWSTGVTTFLPTITTNTKSHLLENISVLARAKNDTSLLGSIAGFHMEGPYISPVDGYRGAHLLKYVRKPDWNEFSEFYEASGRSILQITIAPEVEGAMDFISRCTEKKIVVAIGHHNASTEQVTEAVDRGARIVTHIGNGIANSINRHINPLWPQLADDRLSISIIGDGFHLNREEVRVFYKVKGRNKTILASDVSAYAGKQPGKYITPEGVEIELTSEGALIYPKEKVLYGSASPLKSGIENVMKFTGCSLKDAIQMASTNAAQLYGLTDRGEIKKGMRADLVLFSMEKNHITIRQTMIAGRFVFSDMK